MGATPPPPPTEGSSVEEESMQSGAEEKGDDVEEGREEGAGGYNDGTSYGSTLGESYLEESRKEAAEKPHHPNLLEKESYSGYREEEEVVKRVTIMVLARIWEYPILTTLEEQEIEWMEVNGRDVTLVREMLITL